jgi:hypothetical protein
MRKAILLVSLGSLAALVMVSQSAVANHAYPAPAGAKKTTFSVVPAFNPCAPPGNRTHGLPLGAPSCSPPVQTSTNISFGTATSHSGTGKITLEVVAGPDVKVTATISDVRCRTAVAAGKCPNENGPPAGVNGNDYTGQIQGNQTVRMTDRANSAPAGSHATVVDGNIDVTGTCAATAGITTKGSTCNINTSWDARLPQSGGLVKAGQLRNVELGQVQLNDGGPDGLASTPTNNKVFATQGIFIP